jgi:hypothetical protein
MATRPPKRQRGKKLSRKMAVKKKLLLVSAVKQTQRRSLDPDEIGVRHVDFRVPTSRLLNTGQIVIGDANDGVSILDSDPTDQIRRIDADPNDWP